MIQVTEEVDVVDKNNKKTGVRATKEKVHAKGLWHLAAHVWIYNSKGEILLQKRSMEKDSWPGMWDISAAGHLSAGETAEQAAVREIKEEIGVEANDEDLKQIMVNKSSTIPKPGYYNNEFDYVYLFKLNGLPKHLQSTEVEKVKFLPIEKFERELKNKEAARKYVPHSYYPRLIKALKKALK